uniref:Transposase n=1 Tax=Steinernema glaseri TaxID=37863 RepID=A0A1I7Y7Z7_9BILA
MECRFLFDAFNRFLFKCKFWANDVAVAWIRVTADRRPIAAAYRRSAAPVLSGRLSSRLMSVRHVSVHTWSLCLCWAPIDA